jgi:hypothetical protein
MKTTVGKARQDIATGWAAALGVSVPSYVQGEEIMVEDLGDGYFRPINPKEGVPTGTLIPARLLDFSLETP